MAKSVGDNVDKDETILEISTDKVDSEIPAPASGKIVEIVANEGDTVPVKSIIAVIDSAENAQIVKSSNQTPAATSPVATPEPTQVSAPAATSTAVDNTVANQAASAGAIPAQVADRFYSP